MTKRIVAIDLLRGLIMIFMALDHASFFVARNHYSEMWGVDLLPYDSTLWWFTRFVSHLCAPGFFLLMGISMAMFMASRTKAGWSAAKIRNYFVKRGFILLLVLIFIETPAWISGALSATEGAFTAHPAPRPGGLGAIFLGVLYGLGMSMIVSAFMLRWSVAILLLVGLFSISFSSIFIAEFADPVVTYHL